MVAVSRYETASLTSDDIADAIYSLGRKTSVRGLGLCLKRASRERLFDASRRLLHSNTVKGQDAERQVQWPLRTIGGHAS